MTAEKHLQQVEELYRTKTTAEIAAIFGTTPANMRSLVSRYGIRDPKQKEKEKNRRLALKFFHKGWSYADIAEQLEKSIAAVRMIIKRAQPKKREWVQGVLFEVPAIGEPKQAPKMRVVHVREQMDPAQLSLFDIKLLLAA